MHGFAAAETLQILRKRERGVIAAARIAAKTTRARAAQRPLFTGCAATAVSTLGLSSAVQSIAIAGKGDAVKVATFNGTPFALDMIRDGSIEMDIGENLD